MLESSLSDFLILILDTQTSLFAYLFILSSAAAAAAKSLQSCATLCDLSPPGSSVPGILQVSILEWVAISFSKACMHVKSLQLCQLCVTLWTAGHQAPLSTGFSRKDSGIGCHFPSSRWMKLPDI